MGSSLSRKKTVVIFLDKLSYLFKILVFLSIKNIVYRLLI